MHVLVVDGGGTRTRGYLMKRTGRKIIEQAAAGPSNFGQVGADGFEKVLCEIRDALPGEPKPEAVVIGLAGAGREAECEAAQAVVRRVYPDRSVHLTSDAELAYRGAFAGGPRGILIIAGTGTIAMYRSPDGEFQRVGGWGPLLGDEAGGAWLGREAIRRCLFEWEDDRLSPFHAAVLEKLGVDSTPSILTHVYYDNTGWSDWAGLAPLVFRYAREDPGALSIVQRTAILLVGMAERLEKHLPHTLPTIPVAVTGGLWAHRHHLQPLMEEEIRLRNLPMAVRDPVGGPDLGGLMLLEEKAI